jgi:serine/threonine protein kinase
MEWLDGEDLARRLSREGLTIDESIALVRRVAEALGCAHAAGVMHRDVKPGNLFLRGGRPDGVVLLDFGLARRWGTDAITRTGMMVGTPAYMAPEQAERGATALDARADVFALGCVLFECLTGQAAFSGETFMALVAKLLLDEVPPPSRLRPEVPPELDALCARLLAKQPGARPPDGAAVAALLAELPSIASSSPPRPAAPPRPLALAEHEQHLLGVLLVGKVPGLDGVAALDDTMAAGSSASVEELAAEVARHGGKLTALADGAAVATLWSDGGALCSRAAAPSPTRAGTLTRRSRRARR